MTKEGRVASSEQVKSKNTVTLTVLLTGTLKLNQHNTVTLTVLLTGTLKLNQLNTATLTVLLTSAESGSPSVSSSSSCER